MFYRLRLWFNEFRRFSARQPPIRLLLAALCALALIGLLIAQWTRPPPSPYDAPEIVAIHDRGVLRAGLRNDIPGFAFQNPETGAWSGLEVDMANAVAQAVFGEAGRCEFVPVSSRSLSRLDNREVDIVLCQLTASNTLYHYTPAYYTDAFAAMTMAGSASASLAALNGRTVGLVQDVDAPKPDEPAAMLALDEYGDANGLAYTYMLFASYPELMEALEGRRIDAALMKAAFLPKYFGPDKAAVPEAVSKLQYCAAVRKGEAGLLEIASEAIGLMAESGELERLREAHSLPKF